ncbi:hypothetical protein GCM10010492_16660 [Saccharothrix mutabilis subsp. mutabilis]|uniref:Uncharacterized protein n=1 Tax=Saccharothrix mutabilis subsp. mutabilis TaxID=66855 RepID=A0ABN0TEA1_9PSEU
MEAARTRADGQAAGGTVLAAGGAAAVRRAGGGGAAGGTVLAAGGGRGDGGGQCGGRGGGLRRVVVPRWENGVGGRRPRLPPAHVGPIKTPPTAIVAGFRAARTESRCRCRVATPRTRCRRTA